MTTMQAKTQHVVVIPYPAQGHITPMLQLCRQLAPFGFTFTFINTHHIHQRVQRSRTPASDAHLHDAGNDNQNSQDAHAQPDAHPADSALLPPPHQDTGCSSIRMVFIAGGCAPELHGYAAGWFEAFKSAQDMEEPVEKLLSQIIQEQAVAFILSDVLLGWSSTTAHKFRLPWVGCFPPSANACASLLHFSDLAAEGKRIPVEEAGGGDIIIEGIPGLPPLHGYNLPRVWDSKTGKIEKNAVLSAVAAVKEASFLVLNTFEVLDGPVLEALRKRVRTLALGPLLPSHYMLRTAGPDKELEAPLSLFPEDRTCLSWLDKQAPSSVLFISFGSISLRAEKQLKELELGVEASGCRFLWVRRPDKDAQGSDAAKAAAQESRNGLIVPWAPQLEVLSHPAVGGFITHCGWNSIIESVSMGVPMLCWADWGERMTNQRFVVDIWKCGVDMVPENKQATQFIDDNVDTSMLVGRDEVEKSVRLLMLEPAGAPIRARAAQFRDMAITASRDSHTLFKEFVVAMEEQTLPRDP